MKQGYTATSMRQVAAAANIGKATIYHHFPDKQTIAMVLLQQYLDRMAATLDRIRAETDPRLLIRAAAEVSLGFLFDSTDILEIVRREIPEGRQAIKVGFQSYFQDFDALLADGIRRGTEAGIFRHIDPSLAARVLLTLVKGTFANVHLGGKRPNSPEAAAEDLLDIYFQGVDVR